MFASVLNAFAFGNLVWFRWLEDGAVISSLMMVCAVLASLALGVLVAYGICLAMFRVFRVHAESAARGRVKATATRVALEG